MHSLELTDRGVMGILREGECAGETVCGALARKTVMSSSFIRTLAIGIAAIGLAPSAFAVLDSVGPVDPAHGFPQWYMDKQGLALELCVNTDAAVLAAGGCAILPAALPAGVLTVPEVFPANWASEHFYTLATVTLGTAGLDKKTGAAISGAGRLVVNMGLVGSFVTGVPTPGAQITFNRWRVRQDNLACTGNYTYYTPNNAPQTFSGAAGGRMAQTADIGIGTFDGPLAGTTGPFLQWSATPGGAVKPPFIGADGRKYIADYGAVGTPVTGSVLPNPLRASTRAWIPAEIKAMPFANYVLAEGPGVATGDCTLTESVYTTTGFQLFGRYFDGPIPSARSVDRATFRAVDTNADGVPDSFQVGVWATIQQKPGGALPQAGMSLFSGDPAAPSNVTPELAMTRLQLPGAGTAQPKFELFQGTAVAATSAGQGPLSSRPTATHARMRIISDVPASVVDSPLVDELRISQALWDSTTKTLTVTAESGSILAVATPLSQTAANADCSAPCLRVDSFGLPAKDALGAAIDFKMKTSTGQRYAILTTAIPNVAVPPRSVTVVSSNGGSDTQPVMYAGSATGTAILQRDIASTTLNTPVTIPVLANDIGIATTPALQICTAATGGTCGVPSATAVCVVNIASPSCTVSGGRLTITADNRVVYSPRLNLGGITETFWYQASTLFGTARGEVTVNLGATGGSPIARDDPGYSGVAGASATYTVLANDFAPAGVNSASLRITQAPCNLTSGACNATAAGFNAAGALVFTPPGAGRWTMAYAFNDSNGTAAVPGVVTVNALAAEALTVQRARWTAPKKPGQLGTLDANGTSSVALGQTIELRVPNAATGPQGCSNPTAGTRIASTVAAGGVWVLGATALAARPATVYAYSPTYGGCAQVTVP